MTEAARLGVGLNKLHKQQQQQERMQGLISQSTSSKVGSSPATLLPCNSAFAQETATADNLC
jgi:hypothetical protein